MHTTRSRLAAGLVAAAAALSLPVAAQADPLPPIAPAAFHVKYILPPRSAGDYWAVRTAAEAAGYEVVENDGRPVRD
jgi:ABC-type sugar transport system substrate-binding protein